MGRNNSTQGNQTKLTLAGYTVMPVSLVLIPLALLLFSRQLSAHGSLTLSRDEDPSEPLPAGVAVETVADQLAWPIAMAFAPDGRLFFTEKAGYEDEGPASIWIIEHDQIQPEPFATIQVTSLNERGLLGIAIDPEFEHNRYVYAFYTRLNPLSNRVVRFRDENGVGVEPTIILDVPYETHADLPNERHNGGNIHFGPDGKLYVTIGDNNFLWNAQDLDVLPGKILRLNSDGSAPEDNPFYTTAEAPRSKIYAFGLRNTFDFTFDFVSGSMFATENGDQCDDELNRIEAGGNYGWPLTAPCEPPPPGTIPPLRTYTPTIVPTGVVIYDGDLIPEWQGDLFFCDFKTGSLRHAELTEDRTAITSVAVVDIPQPCHIDLAVDPDGALYFTSWDGFGPGSIYRISSFSFNKTVSRQTAVTGARLTYTLDAAGTVPTQAFTVTDRLPTAVTYVPGSAQTTTGSVNFDAGTLTWWGTFQDDTEFRASYAATVTAGVELSLMVENEATLQTGSAVRKAWARILVNPVRQLMPLIRR